MASCSSMSFANPLTGGNCAEGRLSAGLSGPARKPHPAVHDNQRSALPTRAPRQLGAAGHVVRPAASRQPLTPIPQMQQQKQPSYAALAAGPQKVLDNQTSTLGAEEQALPQQPAAEAVKLVSQPAADRSPVRTASGTPRAQKSHEAPWAQYHRQELGSASMLRKKLQPDQLATPPGQIEMDALAKARQEYYEDKLRMLANMASRQAIA